MGNDYGALCVSCSTMENEVPLFVLFYSIKTKIIDIWKFKKKTIPGSFFFETVIFLKKEVLLFDVQPTTKQPFTIFFSYSKYIVTFRI